MEEILGSFKLKSKSVTVTSRLTQPFLSMLDELAYMKLRLPLIDSKLDNFSTNL